MLSVIPGRTAVNFSEHADEMPVALKPGFFNSISASDSLFRLMNSVTPIPVTFLKEWHR